MEQCIAVVGAVFLNVVLVVLPMLIGDWYGFAALLSLLSLVLVRNWILNDFRRSVHYRVGKATSGTKENEVKLFITLPIGTPVTAVNTTGIIQKCLLTEAKPRSKEVHMTARTVCWLAFGIHTVTLGMACLAVQLLIITLTIAFSVAMVQSWYTDRHDSTETRIGGRLVIKQRNNGGFGTMASVYALLDLSEEEEQTMVDWALYRQSVTSCGGRHSSSSRKMLSVIHRS
jgi:hypothetical protein